MKVFIVLTLALGGVWSIAAGFAPLAIPLWVGTVAIAGSKNARDGIDSFFAVLLGTLLIACALLWSWQFFKSMMGW